MKHFINTIVSFLGLFFITLVTGIIVTLITKDISLTLAIITIIFILGFIGLIKQSYTESLHN